MYLDPSVLQSKTVSKIVDVLKLARTITKGGSNYNNKINIMQNRDYQFEFNSIKVY